MTNSQETQTPEGLRDTLCELILDVAPDLTREDFSSDVDLRYDLGLDSIDLLNVANGIAERIGIEIPEVDRAGLTSIEAILDYLRKHPVEG